MTGQRPQASRPTFPDGYGLPTGSEGLLQWEQIEQRLVAARHYWLTSVRPDGRPHSVPRWGVWVDGRFWYDGAPTTVHARNTERNPAVTLTLESGSQAVIVEGESHATRADPQTMGVRLSEAFRKYGEDYAPGPDSWKDERTSGLRVITPSRAIAWLDYPADATRFTF